MKTYDGEPLTASGECYSQYNNELFQTRIDFKVTETRTEVGSSVNTYSLPIIGQEVVIIRSLKTSNC